MSVLMFGEDFWKCSLSQWARNPDIEKIAFRFSTSIPNPNDPNSIDRAARKALIFVDSGNVLSNCPSINSNGQPCNGAEIVFKNTGDPLMWCCSCGNRDLNFKWRPVYMPSEDSMNELYEILLDLPVPQTSWLSTQSLEEARKRADIILKSLEE